MLAAHFSADTIVLDGALGDVFRSDRALGVRVACFILIVT
jgi:hypothetical protein